MKRDWEMHALQALRNSAVTVPGEINFIAAAGGATREMLMSSWRVPPGRLHSTIAAAYAKVAGKLNGANTTFLLSPDNHSLGATLTWSANMTHLIGMFPSLMGLNNRSRIGMSTTFSPMITVSGYGNLFENLYTMHGTAATDYIGMTISGARNRFRNFHFGGPMNAAQGGHASYNGVNVTGSENTFEQCIFGTDTIGRDEVTPNVTLGAGTLTLFKDCIFLCNLTDGDPVFVSALNTTGYTWAVFDRCKFLAFNSNYATAMTKAFHFTGAASCAMNFTPDCVFQNVTALSASNKDQHIYLPRVFSTTTDTEAMISTVLTV